MASTGALIHHILPDVEALTHDVLFGTVWQDARLSKRDRSLVTLAVLLAQRADAPLRGHVLRGLGHGLTLDEITALVTHVTLYAGWGVAEHAARILADMDIGHLHADEPCTKICCPDHTARAD